MIRELLCTYMPDGKAKIEHYNPWKYCKVCGFCHDADFKRCLAQVKRK